VGWWSRVGAKAATGLRYLPINFWVPAQFLPNCSGFINIGAGVMMKGVFRQGMQTVWQHYFGLAGIVLPGSESEISVSGFCFGLCFTVVSVSDFAILLQ